MIVINAPCIIVFLYSIKFIWACPLVCKCLHTRVSCEDAKLRTENLTTVIDQLSNSTEILYLGNNLIDDFPIYLFLKLKNLRQLHLRKNYLTKIPNNTGLYLPNLRELNLEENRIKSISRNDFIGYSQVRTLYLQENRIKEIPERSFETLTELRYLYLEFNEIKIVSKYSFHGINKLIYLSLGENRIGKIEQGAFDSLEDIQQVFMNNNFITEIPDYIFTYASGINQIDFSINRIEQLSTNSFSNMSNIAMMDLVLFGNLLKNLPSSSFRNSKRLKVDVGENLFQCDCSFFREFYQITQSDQEISFTNGNCFGPNAYKNMRISSINVTALGCNPCKIHQCLNNAKCIPIAHGKSIAKCECLDNFEGEFCEYYRSVKTTLSPQNICMNHNCQNNASCISTGISTYKCQCTSKYDGVLCENIKSDGKTLNISMATWIAIGVLFLGVILTTIIGICLCRRKKQRTKFHMEENKILEEKTDEDMC